MADPITASLIGISAASTMIGGIRQASALRQQSSYNSKVYEMNADLALKESKLNADKYRRELQDLLGTQRASYAVSGVDVSASGTAQVVQESTVAKGASDIQAILYRGNSEAIRLKNQSAIEKWSSGVQSTQTLIASGISGISTILTGSLLGK